jgi:hypothetical protein
MISVQTTRDLDHLARRIEQAYVRRNAGIRQFRNDPRVWTAAASLLVEAPRWDKRIPIDPELFVAVQKRSDVSPDPWDELASTASLKRYVRKVRNMIRELREELKRELRLIRRGLRRGQSLELLLTTSTGHVSSIGCYIAAVQAGRMDLADRHRAGVREQHEACPLYRSACSGMIPSERYPVVEMIVTLDPVWSRRFDDYAYRWN